MNKKEAIATLIDNVSTEKLQENGTEFEVGKNAKGQPALFAKNYKVKTQTSHNKLAEPQTGDQWEQLKPGDPRYSLGLEAYKTAKDLGVTDKIGNMNTQTPDFEVGFDDSLKINFDQGGSTQAQLEESKVPPKGKKMTELAESPSKLCVIVITSFDAEEGMDHTYLSFDASGKVSARIDSKHATWGPTSDMKKSLEYLIEEHILRLSHNEYAWLFYPENQPSGPDGIFDHLTVYPEEYFRDMIEQGICFTR